MDTRESRTGIPKDPERDAQTRGHVYGARGALGALVIVAFFVAVVLVVVSFDVGNPLPIIIGAAVIGSVAGLPRWQNRRDQRSRRASG